MGAGIGGWVGLQKLITDLDMRKGYKGGVRVYEAYEVNKKGTNYVVFNFAGKRKISFCIFMM